MLVASDAKRCIELPIGQIADGSEAEAEASKRRWTGGEAAGKDSPVRLKNDRRGAVVATQEVGDDFPAHTEGGIELAGGSEPGDSEVAACRTGRPRLTNDDDLAVGLKSDGARHGARSTEIDRDLAAAAKRRIKLSRRRKRRGGQADR